MRSTLHCCLMLASCNSVSWLLISRRLGSAGCRTHSCRHRPPISFQPADIDCFASRPAQILRLQEMVHRSCIGAAGLKRPFNGETQTFLTELPGEYEQFDHLSCSGFACPDGSSTTARSDRSCVATDQPGVAAPGGASLPGPLLS